MIVVPLKDLLQSLCLVWLELSTIPQNASFSNDPRQNTGTISLGTHDKTHIHGRSQRYLSASMRIIL
jgi:hypothetical protein